VAPDLGTRDRIAHGYFDINLDTVWDILTLDDAAGYENATRPR
jgi:uncharacterized protein with HEPN domain